MIPYLHICAHALVAQGRAKLFKKVQDSIEEVNVNGFIMKTLNSCPHYHNIE